MSTYAGNMNTGRRGGGVARLAAIVLVIFGGLFTILSLLGFLGDQLRLTAGGLILLGVLGLALCISGVLWLRSLAVGDEADTRTAQDRMVLDLAARSGGRLTLPQVVQATSLSGDQAQQILERLASQQLFELDLLDDGTVVYRFRGLGEGKA